MPFDRVLPQHWRSRTAIWSRSRGTTLRQIDEAYEEWYRFNSLENARTLWTLLEAYLVAHGGHWSKIDRNVASKGLMASLHQYLASLIRGVPEPTRFDTAAAHARLGVLYLFANTNVEAQHLTVCLEGALKVTGASAPLISNSWAQTGVTAGTALGGIGHKVAQSQYTGDGNNILASVSTRTRSSAQVSRAPTPPPPPPRPAVMLMGPPGMVPISLVVSDADALFGGPLASVWHGLGSLASWVEEQFRGVYEWCRSMILRNQRATMRTISQIISAAVKYVLKAAVPFIGGALDLKDGIMQVISAAKQRIEVFLLREKFAIQPGHPEVLANSIESAMNSAMATGLWNAMKGAAKLGLTFVSAGASVIADVVLAALEFIIKSVMRLFEAEDMQDQFALAKLHYGACREQDPDDPKRVRPKAGSLVTNVGEFTKFYQTMCDASPCIPILTLNSSICGSLMDLIKLFDDTTAKTVVSQASFTAGAEYFQALKTFGTQYLQKSGFRFTSEDANVRGLLGHAISHHSQGNISGWDAAIGLLGG
jgi:hypothetical protein